MFNFNYSQAMTSPWQGAQAGGFSPLGFGQNSYSNMSMGFFNAAMFTMMAQLMQMMAATGGMANPYANFGGDGMGTGTTSPLNDFLGGGTTGGSSSGGGASAVKKAKKHSSGGGGGGGFKATGDGTKLGPIKGVTGKTKKFIDLALSKRGTPYVLGASGPNKFDCSGLVSWALKQAGVKGGRTTARGLQARYAGSAIKNKSDLKPGDLVFFWYPNNRGIPRGKASHVEIYLGNGKTMGTDNPREGARAEKIDWNAFIGGARVPGLQK